MIRKSWLDPYKCNLLIEELRDIRDYKSGGKWRAAFSDSPSSLSLKGSSVLSTSREWRPRTKQLKTEIEKYLGCKLNFVLINHYEGRDLIKYHSDNETNSDPLIVSISLGAKRTFRVYNKKTTKEEEWELENGDLFVMEGDFNRNHFHCVPPSKVTGYRINLTFRFVYERIIRPPPIKPYDRKCECPSFLSLVKRGGVKSGDVKWKRWGNVGDFVVLGEDAADIENNKKKTGREEDAPDLYLRFFGENRIELLVKTKEKCKVLFPRGAMFMPWAVNRFQLFNLLHDS